MKYDKENAQAWFKGLTKCLPQIDQMVSQLPTGALIIGACVLDIYYHQGWIPPLKRRTGDLDLSIGLVHDSESYEIGKRELIKAGYQKDPDHEYRFNSPQQLPGALTYIDLLAHPASSQATANMARAAMGSGPGFSFRAMDFALMKTFSIEKNLSFPNPLAFTALKLRAYQDDFTRRLKDLADVAEMAYGLVEKGVHFEIPDLWGQLGDHTEAMFVRKTLEELGGGNSPQWDLEDARTELAQRNFSEVEIDEVIPERILALAENLKVK